MKTAASLKIRKWREDPVMFVRDCFGAEPDAWQVEILRAIPHKNRLAMKAAKGCGKSTILAWCSWWFLSTRVHPKIAATSISGDNLADGLWAEMSKWQVRSPFLQAAFEWTKTRIFAKESPATWWMSARSWPKGADSSQQANTLAGLHADSLLFVLDEVGGIPDGVMAAAEAGLSTGGDTKILMAGNPTHLEGPLYRACTSERDLWYVAEITGDPDSPTRAPRISAEWAREQIKKYGPDNPYVLINVFGRFPPTSLNTLLGPDEVEEAMSRTVGETAIVGSQKRLGVDVAFQGDDRTVIFPRQGIIAFNPVEMRNARPQEIAARVVQAKLKWDSEMELVDATGGYGAGVCDFMTQAGHSPIEVQFAGRAIDSRYGNKRAEMYFLLAEWVKRGGCLPNRPGLKKELTAPTYYLKNGKFMLEPKDQIKDRLGFSVDEADALALTFALPEMPARVNQFGQVIQKATKAVSEWDPFADPK